MAKRHDNARRNPGGVLARWRGSSAAWLAALVFIFQVAASAAHAPAQAPPIDSAAAALSIAIGQEVSLCADGNGDHPGAPGHSSPCCDDCALCGAACHASVLTPARHALLSAPDRLIAKIFAAGVQANAPPAIFLSKVRSRAPPVLV